MLCKLEEIDCYRLQSTSEDKGPGIQAPVMRVKCARYWPQCVKETMFFGEFYFLSKFRAGVDNRAARPANFQPVRAEKVERG